MYDRQLLLSGAKRNEVLQLWEVQRYGIDSYDDADYVSIYGMSPSEWHAKGIRLVGRTAVECARDRLGESIARDVATAAAMAPSAAGVLAIDPFVGSGNTLYWLLRCIPAARGLGLELDEVVFRLTRQNLAALGVPIEIRHTDYALGLDGVVAVPDQLLVIFIAPPWGDALSTVSGLDLRRTAPPIREIVDFVRDRFAQSRLLCVIQVYEIVAPASLAELRPCFDWSAQRVYGLDAPGKNHGILLGAKGWAPDA